MQLPFQNFPIHLQVFTSILSSLLILKDLSLVILSTFPGSSTFPQQALILILFSDEKIVLLKINVSIHLHACSKPVSYDQEIQFLLINYPFSLI